MTNRFLSAIALASVLGVTALASTGCAVARDQQTVGSYIDDATLTTQVKAKLAQSPDTSAMAISVETLNGEVQLSGFAKNAQEKARAGEIARSVDNVKGVKNNLTIR
ncbi:BON domain-containing protein [Lampropedia aestuarii]|uniref:BON domain-containing protein n=1 Tax=Lampropedia aestuarii TaxID=2562762 RepID=A0A4S5BWX4_9BURK|nr:BON domain-containing protein [Lampropedia aestuarii]MDH5857937.1 BON domain-containing protein [Lampropedia aestuarii]THJ34528.1 BON domain-containing protein [Lampropedia aestuarii]